MKLSTRMTIAMVTLVLLTVVAVGGLTYRNLKAVMLPRSLDRIQLDLRLLTTDLASYVGGARQDIAGFRSAAAMQGIVRAHLGGGTDPWDNISEATWRQRLAERFAAELAAKPAYDKFRVIGFDKGRELIRVDRSGPDGTIRIVPDEDLEYRGDRKFFGAAAETPADKIYISPSPAQPQQSRHRRSDAARANPSDCSNNTISRANKAVRPRHHRRRHAADPS